MTLTSKTLTGKSPTGKSPTGKSPTGKSPTGKSPTGKSPTGKSPTGNSPVQPVALISGRYQRAFTIAVVFLVAGWHLAGAGGQLLRNRPDYGSFAFQVAMWLVMALAITAGSVVVLRGTPGWRLAWAVAVITLAASTAAAVASPACQMLAVNWAWGSARLDRPAGAAPPPVRRARLVPRR